MTMRKLACSFLITIIISMSFLIPLFKVSTFYSYAALNDDSHYENLRQRSDLVDAFQVYCKSRDLTIEGSATDVITTWTTSAFNKACNNVGINITQIQAEIKAQYDELGKPTQYLFNSVGVGLMNRVFAQFLQDNELEVNDPVDNKYVYQGYYYGGALVFIFDTKYESSDRTVAISESNILQHGTYYKYTTEDLTNMVGSVPDFSPFNYSKTVLQNFYSSAVGSPYRYSGSAIGGIEGKIIFARESDPMYPTSGYPIVYTSLDSAYMNLGNLVNSKGNLYIMNFAKINFSNIDNANVYIYSPTINNNNYEGDTIINNDGDIIINYPDDSDYNPYPDNPNYPDSPGTITPPTDPSNPPDGSGGGTITFPDIDLNLPEINWSIGDLSEKFPFSIPFDLIAFFTVLNAAPEAPAIDADIPLGNWYTWHFEADFSQYDNWAALIRNVEFIAFCVGLIYLTVRFVKG